MEMGKIGRSGGSVWTDHGTRKGERRDHEPRGGRERWRDGMVKFGRSGGKGERRDHELSGW
jgi:hypothetical protein